MQRPPATAGAAVSYRWLGPNSGVTARPYGQGLGQGVGTSGSQLGEVYGGCDAIYQF